MIASQSLEAVGARAPEAEAERGQCQPVSLRDREKCAEGVIGTGGRLAMDSTLFSELRSEVL